MLASMLEYLQYLHQGMMIARKIMESLEQMFDRTKNPKDVDFNDVIQKKLAEGISVHDLYVREMGSLKTVEFRFVDIHKHVSLMK